MATDVGEHIVGAYLKIIEECDFIDYNVRVPGGGRKGLNEIDVVGFNFRKGIVFLCEVTTHIHGVLYGNYDETFLKIRDKFVHQKKYASQHLKFLKSKEYMFWSPVVPEGKLTAKLKKLSGLQLIINKEYTKRVRKLEKAAEELTHETGNPFFRTLQILSHLRPLS